MPPLAGGARLLGGDIAAGTHTANLREVAERALAARSGRAREIRSREIRGRAVAASGLRLVDTAYATSTGGERFLEWVTDDDRIAAFVRLALPAGDALWPELEGCALIREVHVYGASLPLGERAGAAAQHAGLGRALIDQVAGIARDAGYARLAVISAVGTRPYYRRLGFRDGGALPAPALSVRSAKRCGARLAARTHEEAHVLADHADLRVVELLRDRRVLLALFADRARDSERRPLSLWRARLARKECAFTSLPCFVCACRRCRGTCAVLSRSALPSDSRRLER